MSTFLADGIGGSTGDSLALEIGFIGMGSVWYVSSESGTDASGHGRNREDPFATIPYAIDSVSSGDTIVVLADHNESMTVGYDIAKTVVIVGEGSAGGVPTSCWGHDALGSDEVLTVSADDVEIRNIKFTAPEQIVTIDRITWEGDNGKMRGCYFEADVNESVGTLMVVGDHLLLDSCTFISVGANLSDRPARALSVDAATPTVFRMDSCVVSGGSSGWSSTNGAVYVQKGTGLTVRIEAMSLLLGSDLVLTSGCSGFVSVPVATGGAQVRGF